MILYQLHYFTQNAIVKHLQIAYSSLQQELQMKKMAKKKSMHITSYPSLNIDLQHLFIYFKIHNPIIHPIYFITTIMQTF